MDEPLLGCSPVAVELEPHAGLGVVKSTDAGPAGTVGLVLGENLELDIDVAEPTTLVGLRIDFSLGEGGRVVADGVRRRLDALLGVARSDELLDQLGAAGRGPLPGCLRLQDRCHQQAFAGDSSLRHTHRGVAPALHRAALAYAAATEVGAPPVVRAVGRLEAAVELSRAPAALGVGAVARRDARLGIDLLLDLAARSGLAVPHIAASNLAALLRAAAEGLGSRRTQRRALLARASEIERGEHDVTSQPRAEASTRRSMATHGATTDRDATHNALAGRRHPRVDVRALPGALADGPPVARRAGVSEVEVRIPDGADYRHDLWARAFQTRHKVLVATAPFRGEARDAVARLLVSPYDMRYLEVDVTDRPELPRPSAVLCAVQRAIYHGRLAARAQRLDQAQPSADRWHQCAREWIAAGDEDRAEQAAVYGRGQATDLWPTGRVIIPLLSDLLWRH